MKGVLIAFVVCYAVFGVAYGALKDTVEDTSCAESDLSNFPTAWIKMNQVCIDDMKEQIHKELNASMTYLAMGAYFANDTVNRPGFAKLFFQAASEEREHAIKLIQYLLMRGQFTQDITSVINPERVFKIKRASRWTSGAQALKDALDLEALVTNSIRNVIENCEDSCKKNPQNCQSFNDYHLVDYLTGDFLEEQYKGQRDLAGKLSILEKMMKKHKDIGEFLFDKQLLSADM